ncbi:hypothetical protein GCM10022243_35130 [Saccharothrix violaceirubra]|uniref:DUF3515 domain-containing protein n=1 Tax=Saccharothrix violaceirubra TaxID=413306 RepID=A0A7W7WU75_9PSEU|nr:DUF3515 domain-containing protein [Saccharothrix violaceirubra]MBB4963886.1 hypothetical protein [Saccharothrix violaceirubra]
MAPEPERTSLLPRPLLAVAIGLPALLAAGVAAAGLFLGTGSETPGGPTTVPTGPLALVPVPAPKAASPECAGLLAKLPMQLLSSGVTLPRRELAAPAPEGALAWSDSTHSPLVLRCGLDRPADLEPTSQLRIISDVQWLEVADGPNATWYVVDRPVYVALTVPSDAGTGPLQDVSTTIRDTLPKTPVDTRG